jgi:hypothetical protein
MPPSASAGLPSGAPTPGQASRPSIRATHGHRRGRPRARRATAAPRGGPRPGGLMGAGAYAVLDRGLWYGKSAPFRAVQTAPRRCGAGEVTPRRNAAPARAGRGHMFRPRRSLPDRPRWRTCQVPAAGETSSAFGAMGRGPSGVHPAAARIRAPRRHTAHPIARVRMCDQDIQNDLARAMQAADPWSTSRHGLRKRQGLDGAPTTPLSVLDQARWERARSQAVPLLLI